MTKYVTEAEINEYLGVTIATSLNNTLNDFASAYINNYLQVTDLAAQTTYTEIQDYTWGTRYMLSELNPSNLTLVNSSAVVWTINLTWRELNFQFAPINTDTVFNKISFTYDYGYATIPDVIKQVALSIVWYLYNSRSTWNMKSFNQGQISITYKDTEEIKMIPTNNETITIKRWVETSGESAYVELITSLSCYIEPADFDTFANVDGADIADVFNLLCDNTNIIVWDRIIDSAWLKYTVKGTKLFNSIIWTHIEATLLRKYD